MTAHFFEDAEEAHRWFSRNHAKQGELLVGFWKVGSGERGAGYQQVLDEALCFGWIDGLRRRLDDRRWTIRFTPRKPGSIWSGVNIRRVGELIAQERMRPAGLKAFQARDEKRSRVYAYEATRSTPLGPEEAKAFQAAKKAWAYFQAQRPSYRKQATYWVMTAKKEETRARRLKALIDSSARQQWLPQYQWTLKKKR
ncbi:MAG TPA: YdeI/OmpD-associated family protein [Myxococcales bacterium]|nr:YdeI/OmpD-associated family protein [Myxococcales bacterium]